MVGTLERWTLVVARVLLGFGVAVVGAASAGDGLPAPASGRPGDIFATALREVERAPTTPERLSERFHRLLSLALVGVAECGRDRIDRILPERTISEIQSLIGAGDAARACGKIDGAFGALARATEGAVPLARWRRVSFTSSTGSEVVGLLASPPRPGTSAFVFGHGGFGTKEVWLDLMRAVADRTGAYALTIDFEGCGESSGHTSWRGRIADFSAAIDYLGRELGVRDFGVGGHSGGGAYPAACAAITDPRISTLVLWDCIFDFYDTHIAAGAPDPGGNPAPLLERTWRNAQGRSLVPPQVDPSRRIGERLDDIYREIEETLLQYRHPARLLGVEQKKRRLAVLHIVAEDLIRAIGPGSQGETFTLPGRAAAPARARFHDRPLPMRVSGLFNRPEALWKRWDAELGTPKETVVVERTTHGFEAPGRFKGIDATVRWIREHLVEGTPPGRSTRRTRVAVPVRSSSATVLGSVPDADRGSDVTDFRSAFPGKALVARGGTVALDVGREPVYVLDGDTSVQGSLAATSSPFGFLPAHVVDDPAFPGRPFGAAEEIGVRWHRLDLGFAWIKIQPTKADIAGSTFHWKDADRTIGAVPPSIAVLANIGLPERRVADASKGKTGHPLSWSWRLSEPEADYVRFVKAVVERYDGDGRSDMPGLRVPVRHWQVENEPDLSHARDWEGYARVQELTYGAIKEADPGAMVLMGGQAGGVPAFDTFFTPVLRKLGGRYVDAFDFHLYGDARLEWRKVRREYEHIRKWLDSLGYRRTEIWVTEMGTYSGTPGDETGPGTGRMGPPELGLTGPPPVRMHPQTEREQARDLVKRHAFPLALGARKVFWAFGLMEGFERADDIFDHTGLIHDGEFDASPPRGTRKLAYHAYRRMTELLDGADWSRSEFLELGPDVHAVRVARGRGTVTVLWHDPPYRLSEVLSGETIQRARLALDSLRKPRIGSSSAGGRLEELIALIEGLARDAGPELVDEWASPAAVLALRTKVRGGAADAHLAIDRMIGRARAALDGAGRQE